MIRTRTIVRLASLLVVVAAGCHSKPKTAAYYDGSADSTENNRLLIRMAMEENVYGGVASERAIYPKDFRPGTAELNPLGIRRVDMLVDASRNARGEIAVLRGGDESDDLYTDRVAAVRDALTNAGVKNVVVAKADHVPVAGTSSDRAILTYTKLMSEYAPKSTNSGGSSSSSSSSNSNSTTNNPSGAKGQ